MWTLEVDFVPSRVSSLCLVVLVPWLSTSLLRKFEEPRLQTKPLFGDATSTSRRHAVKPRSLRDRAKSRRRSDATGQHHQHCPLSCDAHTGRVKPARRPAGPPGAFSVGGPSAGVERQCGGAHSVACWAVTRRQYAGPRCPAPAGASGWLSSAGQVAELAAGSALGCG